MIKIESNYDKDYNEVMELLLTVAGVKEHLESDEVRKFKEDTLKRLEGLKGGVTNGHIQNNELV